MIRGNVTAYTLTDVSIDELVLGVKATDGDGNESRTSPYAQPARQKRKAETY